MDLLNTYLLQWFLMNYYLALPYNPLFMFNIKFRTLKTRVGNHVFIWEHTLFSHNLKQQKLLNVKQLESDV
jgi:hypothetical protein